MPSVYSLVEDTVATVATEINRFKLFGMNMLLMAERLPKGLSCSMCLDDAGWYTYLLISDSWSMNFSGGGSDEVDFREECKDNNTRITFNMKDAELPAKVRASLANAAVLPKEE